MARILHVSASKPDRPAPQVNRRFAFDVPRLLTHFGGYSQIIELARQHGLPEPGNYGKSFVGYVPTLLELAERMHEPLDIYQFVVELR